MEHLFELLIFAGKAVVIVGGLIAIAITIAILAQKAKPKDQLEIENINDKIKNYGLMIRSAVFSKKEMKEHLKKTKSEDKKKDDKTTKKTFVLHFVGDIKASRVKQFADEITTILSLAKTNDEVVVVLESPGGMVHAYGLAASQLLRIREKGLSLTICIDKVAASGGYLMAAVASKIISAPFAIVGSIGVVAQVPNFNKLLKKHDVDYEELTAGEYKRTISVFGEITPKGREKFMEQMEQTHALFKNFVKDHRPQLDLSRVATGEYWYGTQALELHLVDEIKTSDQYLAEKVTEGDVFKLQFEVKKKIGERLSEFMKSVILSTIETLTGPRQF